jgi:hypothetical protein
LNPVAFGVFGFFVAVVASVYLVGPKSREATTAVDPSRSNAAAEVDVPKPAASFDSPATPSSPEPFVSRGQSGARLLPTDDGAGGEQQYLPGLSVDEMARLHAQQQADVERLLGDLDALVVGTDNGSGRPFTVRELRSLHEQQERGVESGDDAEVIIPTAADGSPALTVADVRARHGQQKSAIDANAAPDEIVIAGAENGTVDLKRTEIAALHERQRTASDGDVGLGQDYPAPLGNDRGYSLTVDQLRDMHKNQALE